MNAFLPQDAWDDYFKGWEITDVAVRDVNVVYLCARKSMSYDEASRLWDSDIPSRLIGIFLDEPNVSRDGQWLFLGRQELIGMDFPVLGVSRPPFPTPVGLLAAAGRGDVWPRGSGINGPMELIDPKDTLSLGVARIKSLSSGTYAVCFARRIYRREAPGTWVTVFDPDLRDKAGLDVAGFMDLDAFADDDIYAVGGKGDVWHFDGTAWQQLGFPSNEQLSTVTCAPNGRVYIGGEGCGLWEGRLDRWRQVHNGGASILWNDTLWFDGKLWLSSDYQLRQWNGQEMVTVDDAEGRPVAAFGHMDAADGLLVVASPSTVMAFDGQVWRTIVAPYL